MKYNIATEDCDVFRKMYLTTLLGALELFNKDILQYDEMWFSLLNLKSRDYLEKIGFDKKILKIINLMDELGTVKKCFPDLYPQSLRSIRRRILKEYLKVPSSTCDCESWLSSEPVQQVSSDPVLVQRVSSAPKPQVSDAISGKNMEAEQFDTKQPIDTPIEK